MVFPSLPLYIDPPNSWNQLPQPHQQAAAAAAAVADDNNPPPPTPSTKPGPSGPTRPGSMAERARLAKISQPESPLSCPRCDSTNTKFCYFNNYSLSQPRHFCKTCRRYWTRGGALRNVPVGGGCRRNKHGGKSSSLTATSSPKLQLTPPLSMLAAVTWNQAQEYGFLGQGLERWRLPYLGGMEAAAAGMQVSAPPLVPAMYGYHEGEWGVGGSISGNGEEGWMSSSNTNHVLGFGSSTQNGNL